MKRPDLLLRIAKMEFITAIFGFFTFLAFATFDFSERGYKLGPYLTDKPGALLAMTIMYLISLGYMGIAITAGIGVLKGKEWGRIFGIVHAVLTLPVFLPLTIPLSIRLLTNLTHPDVKEYFRTRKANPFPIRQTNSV